MKKSITGRWLFNILGVVLLLLVVVEIAVAFGIREYYYSSVEQILYSQVNTYTSLMEKAEKNAAVNYGQEIRSMVQNFSERESMEFMAVDINNNIVVTSSGFPVDESPDMPDFDRALEEGTGRYQGYVTTGGEQENVMAVSMLTYPVQDEPIVAVRLVVSLEDVDSQIFTLVLIIALMGVAIIFFVVFSGSYFINSIVIPVGEVSKTARRIAQGDFGTRLEVKTDDEIGNLCRTINHMAEELSTSEQLKNEFISSVSHELRTPLTAIKGWGETLVSDDDISRDTLEQGMRIIMNETDRLSLMVEELLDFSRMQSGRLKYVFDRMDILAEVGEAVLMYTERARRENIELFYEEPAISGEVYGDKNRLRQVFINIIDNAIKYSNPGGVIEVQVGEENDMIYITVSDSGLGISEEDLPKIKDRFYKGSHSRRGSGIGLAVADEIVSAHGGSLDINSEFGVGTTVTILLPAGGQRREAPPAPRDSHL